MFDLVKFKNTLHPWVLLPTAVIGAIIAYCTHTVPINYWHHSKFGHENDVFFNDYFPLIHVFQHLVPNSDLSPINQSNYLAYSAWALVFSLLAVWLLFAITFSLKSKIFQILVVLVLAASVPFIWTTSFALNQSILTFSAVLLLFLLSSNLKERPVISGLILSLVTFLSLGSSIFGVAVCLAVLLSALYINKGKLLAPLSIVIGVLGIYITSDHLTVVISQYLSNGAESFFYVDGTYSKGAESSFFSVFKSFIFHTNPILLIGLVLAPAYLKIKEHALFATTFTIVVGSVLLSFFFKEIALSDGYSTLFLAPALIPCAFFTYHLLAQKKTGSAFVLYAIILASSIYGIKSWLSPSPLNYMSLSQPYESVMVRAGKTNIDHFNMAGIMGLKTLRDQQGDFDTLATNFYYNLPIEGVHAELAGYFRKDLKKHDLGVYILKSLQPDLKRSAGYPPANSITNINYEGVTLATVCAPNRAIKKAFKNIGRSRPGESVVAFRKLTENHPQNPEAWHGYAKSQFLFSTWDDALKAVQVGLSLHPSHIDMLFLQGQIYQKQGRDEDALANWDRCLAIYKGYGKAWWNKGEYYLRKGDYAEARNQLINAKYCDGYYKNVAIKNIQAIDSIEANAKFANGIETYYIDQINQLQGDTDENRARAKDLLDEMAFYINLDSTNAQLRSHFGLVKLMLGDFKSSSLAFEKAIEMNPNFPKMREYLAISRTNWGAEKYQEDSLQAAIFHFRYALDYAPGDYNASSNLSTCYTDWAVDELAEENYERAFKLLREAIYFNSDNPNAFYEMGNLKMAINQPDSAEIAFNQAYMVDNTSARAIEKLIELYTEKGDDYKAQIYKDRLKEALRRQP